MVPLFGVPAGSGLGVYGLSCLGLRGLEGSLRCLGFRVQDFGWTILQPITLRKPVCCF